MKNIKYYNIYMILSSITRNILDIYSAVLLYQKNIPLDKIIVIYIITYLISSIVSTLSLSLGNKIGYIYILLVSTFGNIATFYVINNTNNIYLIALFLSISQYTYHPVKHYYGLTLLNKDSDVSRVIFFTYLATILSSLLTTKKPNIILVVILSIISLIPILFIKEDKKHTKLHKVRISRNKLIYFFLDQARIIFVLFVPLYLYILYKNMTFVKTYNIVLAISSLIFLLLTQKIIPIKKYYLYINILFIISLVIKLNINNKYILILIAVIEGIGIKASELVSTINLYNTSNKDVSYLIFAEIYICLFRSMILFLIYIFKLSIEVFLYILILGILLEGLFYQKRDTS